MSRSAPMCDSPPISRCTAHSSTFISISARDTGVGQVAGHPRRREREQQRRRLRVLEVNRLRPKAFGLLGADPLDQRVDVGVGRHVGGHHPQRRAEAGVVAVQGAVERQPVVVELGRGRDDGRTAVEQTAPTTDAAMDPFDAPVTTATSSAVAALARVLRAGRGAPVQRGVDVATRGQGLALPPGRPACRRRARRPRTAPRGAASRRRSRPRRSATAWPGPRGRWPSGRRTAPPCGRRTPAPPNAASPNRVRR